MRSLLVTGLFVVVLAGCAGTEFTAATTTPVTELATTSSVPAATTTVAEATTVATTLPPTTVATTVPPTTTPPSTDPPTTVTTLPPRATIGVGVHIVGAEVKPSLYRVMTGSGSSYWARLDANQEIIDNDLSTSCPTLLIVDPTDAYIEISGGGARELSLSEPFDPIAEQCTDGVFLVGLDIQPGQYRVLPAGGSTYWARIDGNMGIIDNDLSDGQLIVKIRPGDFAFTFSGTLELIP
jgi:hypothetical protein